MMHSEIRLGALICIDQQLTIVPEAGRRRLKSEIWCLWNGFDPSEFPDLTLSRITTSSLIRIAQQMMTGTPEEIACVLICTMHEVNARMTLCKNQIPSIGSTEQLVRALT